MRLFLLLLLAAWVPALWAQAEPSADEQAIRQQVAKYVAAYNNQDAEALGKLWAKSGIYYSPVSEKQVQGSKAIAAEFAKQFQARPAVQLEVEVDSIRLVSPTVAVEEGNARVVRSNGEVIDTRYTALHVKEDGKWLLDSIRETVVPTLDSNEFFLEELAWMIGDWVDQDDNAVIETSCQWTKNRNFMTKSFKVFVEDQIELEGTQIIGWDASAQQIRSWVFDSDGAFGEGTWTRKGDSWVIKTRGVLRDGSKSTATNILKRIDENAFTWESISREVDGELQPNIEPVTVVRKIPAE